MSLKSVMAIKRELDRTTRAKLLKDMAFKKNVSNVRRLTQAELLADAKITEEINLKALGGY